VEPVSLADDRVIAWQLGREPRALLGVERRCPHGYPQVVRVHPLMEGKPFPTLFWLTCPQLVRAVAELEARGWIDRIEEEVAKDPDLATALRGAHRAYALERASHLSAEERKSLGSSGMLRSLTERGIGGIADFTRLKCLHLHVAHALARGNPVGERVLASLPALACAPDAPLCTAPKDLFHK